jgi:hypothetical protein
MNEPRYRAQSDLIQRIDMLVIGQFTRVWDALPPDRIANFTYQPKVMGGDPHGILGHNRVQIFIIQIKTPGKLRRAGDTLFKTALP